VRFLLVCRYLYFVDRDNGDINDRLSELRFGLDYRNRHFQTMYTPNDDTATDESLVKCHDTLAFLQLNPAKRARLGVRYYKLCGSACECCTQFRIYARNKVWDEDLPSNEAVVMEITWTYPTKGYTLYIDQLYSSSMVLLSSVIGAVGLNRKNMPKNMKTHKLHKDETGPVHPQNGITTVAGSKTVLSYVHSSLQSLRDKHRQKEGEKKQGNLTVKPEVVTVYNRRMVGVDKMYQQLAFFLILMRHCVMAYTVLLF
jgi:hypothetical protein